VKKQIILYWLRGSSPSYAKWNVENFKKMNPEWEVSCIELLSCLEEAQAQSSSLYVNTSNLLKRNVSCKVSKQQNDIALCKALLVSRAAGACVCCSVDCFPIAPVDSFMSMMHFCSGKTFICNEYIASNIIYTSFNLVQVQKNIDLRKPIVKCNDIYVNEDSIEQLEARMSSFKSCSLELEQPFCCPVLSPVEFLGETA